MIPLALLLVLPACGSEPEPLTDLDRLPSDEAETGQADRAAERPNLANARPAVRPEPPTRPPAQPVPPAQAASADPEAPATFAVRLDTTAGPIIIDVTRAWSPHGADRFHRLVSEGFFTDVAFFRVVEGFMAQAGIHGDPAVNVTWRARRIPDDPVVQHNLPGYVSFAMAGPGSRTTQFFINLVDNSRLDSMGFSPFGRVRDMANVGRIHSGYGESAPRGRGPMQGRMQSEGNTYLRSDFPELTYIRSATIVPAR